MQPTIKVDQPVPVKFRTRAGSMIQGDIIEDIGHALVIHVAAGPLKGRALTFQKNDMR